MHTFDTKETVTRIRMCLVMFINKIADYLQQLTMFEAVSYTHLTISETIVTIYSIVKVGVTKQGKWTFLLISLCS